MVNFGPLAAEIGWRQAHFNGFCVRLGFVTGRRNQTLHDVWPSRGLLHYIYNFGAFAS